MVVPICFYNYYGNCTICHQHVPREWRRCPCCWKWCGMNCRRRCWASDDYNSCSPCVMKKAHYDKVHVEMVWKYFHERTDLLCNMQEYLVAPFEWVVGANGSRWEPLPPIAVRVNKCDLYRKWRKACEDAWLRDLLRPR